jgi:hypothetical protein
MREQPQSLATQTAPPPSQTPRCECCGDVIGVYEPMVMRTDDWARTVSWATEPGWRVAAGECYHRACFAHGHEDERTS